MIHDKDKYNNKPKGVKPKNRVYCPDCRRQKMKFDDEKQAHNFIKWNKDNFDEKIPLRIYWCEACCGYHITARPMGGVGVAVNMKLPYLTEALENDKPKVMHAVKTIYHVLSVLKQPSGYYGKIGLGKCKSMLDGLNYIQNPYYIEEREKLYTIVEQQRSKYKDVWMKRKYCRLVKKTLYPILCEIKEDVDTLLYRYNRNLSYILSSANNDEYDINQLPETFLDEWDTLFHASLLCDCLTDKMTVNEISDNGTYKDNQDEENLHEGETDVPGIQVSNQGEGL